MVCNPYKTHKTKLIILWRRETLYTAIRSSARRSNQSSPPGRLPSNDQNPIHQTQHRSQSHLYSQRSRHASSTACHAHPGEREQTGKPRRRRHLHRRSQTRQRQVGFGDSDVARTIGEFGWSWRDGAGGWRCGWGWEVSECGEFQQRRAESKTCQCPIHLFVLIIASTELPLPDGTIDVRVFRRHERCWTSEEAEEMMKGVSSHYFWGRKDLDYV